MFKVETITERRKPITLYPTGDMLVLGLRIHICPSCGVIVNLYILFWHIEIPVWSKPVQKQVVTPLSPEEQEKAMAHIRKHMGSKSPPPVV